jgi:molybdopterin-guanine dinucleotide biosynthesis protein A
MNSFFNSNQYVRGAIILAGGPSVRFGRNKALVILNDRPMIHYAIEQCQKITEKIIVCISKNDSIETFRRILQTDVEIIKDDGGMKSPLTGFKSAIKQFISGYVLVIACDMPFIRSEILDFLFKEVVGFDLAIPRWQNGCVEPLHAVYNIKKVSECLNQITIDDDTRVSDLRFMLNSVNYIDVNILRKIDPYLISFFNVNSEKELTLAEELLNSLLKERELLHDPSVICRPIMS